MERIKHFIKWSIAVVAYYSGYTRRLRRARQDLGQPVILRYHRIADSAFSDPFHLSVSKAVLKGQLKYLKATGDVVSLSALSKRLGREGDSRESIRPVTAITFDDGYLDNYSEAFPVLDAYGIPATIFLTSEFIGTGRRFWWDDLRARIDSCGDTPVAIEWTSADGSLRQLSLDLSSATARRNAIQNLEALLNSLPDSEKEQVLWRLRELSGDTWSSKVPLAMNWDQAAELVKNGIEIGAHGETHRLLPKISKDEARAEIEGSKRAIEERLGIRARYFAYPGGQVEDDHRRFVSEAGFEAAVSTEDGFVDESFDIFALKRRAVHEWVSVNPWGRFSRPMFAATVEGLFSGVRSQRKREKPTRIFYLIDGLTNSGTQKHLLDLVEGLDRKKYDLEVVAMVQGGPLSERLEALGIPFTVMNIRNWNSLKGIWGAVKLWWRIMRFRPDIVHCYLFTANVFGSIIASWLRVPAIVTSRRDLCDTMTERQIRWIRKTHRISDRVLVNSEAVASAVEQTEGLPRSRMKMIHNGVRHPTSLASISTARKTYGVGNARCIGTLSNFRLEKDPMTLIRAFAAIHDRWPDVHLVMAGDAKEPELKAEIDEFIQAAGIESKVVFPGRISEIGAFLRMLEIFVFPSRSEGFSNSVLEAMVCGLPVVASAIGGNMEQVVDGETGILFPAEDDESCAAAIEKLLADEALRRRMGNSAARRAARFFALPEMVTQTENVYLELLGKDLVSSAPEDTRAVS